jgi:hypothetical protein
MDIDKDDGTLQNRGYKALSVAQKRARYMYCLVSSLQNNYMKLVPIAFNNFHNFPVCRKSFANHHMQEKIQNLEQPNH